MEGYLETTQTQSQLQRLVMTQQQQLALKILRCDALEIDDVIEKELEENPLLEPRDEYDPGPSFTEHREARERQVSERHGLVHKLFDQLIEPSITDSERRSAMAVIGNLDGNGYLDVAIGEVARTAGISEAEAQRGLEIVQALEPAGIGARTLSECLALQLKRRGEFDGVAGAIVLSALNLVAAKRFKELSERLAAPVSEVMAAVTLIRSLDPRPGAAFTAEDTVYAVPSVTVTETGGRYSVGAAGDGKAKVRVSDAYRKIAAKTTPEDREAKRFIASKMRAAAWFIRCLYQRESTVRHIAEAIVSSQQRFLKNGIRELRPLTLREVAHKVGVHESTVSRAVSGKFIETPRGTFELKFFFASGLKGKQGEISSESVRDSIRVLVRGENPSRPLSDQALAQMLSNRKIPIARRTVSKYREELGIPPSATRRSTARWEPAHAI